MNWEELYKLYGQKLDLSIFDKVSTVSVNEKEISELSFRCARNWTESRVVKNPDAEGGYSVRRYYYGYDLVKKEDANRIKILYSTVNSRWCYERNSSAAFYSGVCKGTVITLDYLVNIKEPVKRAAVWMYALLRDVLTSQPYGYDMEKTKVIGDVLRKAYGYVTDDCYWHNQMKGLCGVPLSVFSDMKAETCEDLFETGRKGLEYIQDNCEIIHYVTKDEYGELILP